FMAGFTLPDAPEFDEWQFFQADDLRQKLAAALEALIAHYCAQGNTDEAIPLARRFVALDPLHEPAQRLLMQTYAQAGRDSAALRQYELCRQILQAELGVEPAAETQALYRRLRSRPQTETAPAPSHNLPPEPTPFIGRRQELAQLAEFLTGTAVRLLTILGPGGIGKTRLALAAAADLVEKEVFPDGVYFVPLTSLAAPEAIIPAIAEAVGFPFQSDNRPPRQQLFDYLRSRNMLLLLDNFEHLLADEQPDGATLAADLLRHAPQIKLLVTSRERLNLYEEQGYPLGGLDVEDTAVTLFQQAVHRRLPHYETAPAAAIEICRLVDGMPLALELAATWTELLSLREIAARIRQNLDILETDLRNLPARHRSMRAVFDTTWQSLSQTEQAVYARLSLFHGGFTAEAARAVAGASLKMLSTFIGKSLLRFDPRRRRYESHELLRQFAAEKVADSEEVRQRHARYTCAFLHERESDLKGMRQQTALAAIEQELENALTAWQWAAAHRQTDYLAQALESLGLFYQWRKRFGEGEALCRTALAAILPDDATDTLLPPEQRHLAARLLTWQGVFQLAAQQLGRARQAFQQAQALLDDIDLPQQQIAAARASLLLRVSRISMVNDFAGQALTLNEESVTLYRAIGDEWGTALALDALGQIYANLGDFDKAFRLQDECLAIRERLGDQLGIARSYRLLGLLVLHTNQLSRSEAYLQQSLALSRSLGNRGDLLDTLAVLGINQLFSGRFAACLESFAECWAIHEALGLAHEPFTANVTTARALVNLGRYEEARQLTRRTLPGYRQSNDFFYIAFSLLNLGRMALATGDVSGALAYFQESNGLLQGMGERSLRPDAPFCLGYAYRARQDLPRAIQAMREGLDIAIETRPLNPMRFELPLMALLSIDKGEVERAVELYAAARQSPYIAHSRWFEDVAGREIEAAASALPPEAVTAARQRGRDHDLEELALALRVELGE
ncbi:MAG TPA: tetratricopeptide repeat protein, partial [Anaerolineae bacterium]|nr:tetratricopeptide repeat protein [Anaerolineae bacterium]